MKEITYLIFGILLGMALSYYTFVGQNIERGFMQAKAQGMLEVMNQLCPSFVAKVADDQKQKK